METAKRTVLNHNLQLFALNEEGYLVPIYVIVKLYPYMSDKIVIVGWLQCLPKLDGFEREAITAGVVNSKQQDSFEQSF